MRPQSSSQRQLTTTRPRKFNQFFSTILARKSTKSSSRKSRGKSRNTRQSVSLSPQQKLDMIGVVLACFGLLLAFAFFSPSQGVISGTLKSILGQIFGLGRFVIPFILLAIGTYIFARHFREDLPYFAPEQILGCVVLFIGGLVTLHFAHAWYTGIALDQLARASGGGGWIGALFLDRLVIWLGWLGALVVVMVWLVIALLLTFSISTQDIVDYVLGQLERIPRELPPITIGRGAGYQEEIPEAAYRPVRTKYAAPEEIEEDYEEEEDEVEEAPKPTKKATKKTSRKSGANKNAAAEPAVQPKQPAVHPAAPPVGAQSSSQPAAAGHTPLYVGAAEPEQKWELPDIDSILEEGIDSVADDNFDRQRSRTIEETLEAFGAPVSVVEVNRGPTITQFGVEPQYLVQRSGKRVKVKVNKIVSLADDLALALAAPSVRIEAPVPGKGYVGIEVPNEKGSVVSLRDVMETESFRKIKGPLPIALAQDVSGQPVTADLASMPHLLIAGTTGSGKSVCVNSIISALLLTHTPDKLKFIMVDPKRVELTGYNGIPHLLAPVVVEIERVVATLQWIAREMDTRYTKFAHIGARNIEDFNKKAEKANEKKVPYLVVVIDELADLMMLAPEETEKIIARLAQMARATGIHLLIATQRPSVDVVTGLIKANMPSRISFAVASSIDSRVILDSPGAEKLLGQGDMLFMPNDAPQPMRMQGVYLSDDEIAKIVRYWKGTYQFKPAPPETAADVAKEAQSVAQREVANSTAVIGSGAPKTSTAAPQTTTVAAEQPAPQSPTPWEEMQDIQKIENRDELYDDAVRVVRDLKKASISLLQRQLRIGYTRSARLIDTLEEDGIVGPPKPGAQQREVLDYGTEDDSNGLPPTHY